MKINFQHNTLIRETITEGFLRYFNENLLPVLKEKYADEGTEVLFYENTLNLDLTKDGKRYYPLTVIAQGTPVRQWVSWEFPKGNAFLDMNPFAYVASTPLNFFMEDVVPEEFCKLTESIPLDYPREAISVSVSVMTGSVRLLVGKYSQSFLDEMARQLTARIEEAHRVRGIATSSIRLVMSFAPMTFMEHNCEGVTYRRLLMSEEGGRAEKDFWVSWHRQSSDAPVTVSEDITPGEVLFFIGEDVPQKVREKEFRYLTRQNAEKYRSAMGRKTVTEWREFLKKAMKRGELVRVEDTPVVIVPEETTTPIETPVAETLAPETPRAEQITEPVTEMITEPAKETTPEEEDPIMALLRQYAESENTDDGTESPSEEESEATDEYRDAMSLLRDLVDREETSPEVTGDDTPEEDVHEDEETFTEQTCGETTEEEPSESPVHTTSPYSYDALEEVMDYDYDDEDEDEEEYEEEMPEEVDADEEEEPFTEDTSADEDTDEDEETYEEETHGEDPLFTEEPVQETLDFDELISRFNEPLLIEEIAPLPTYTSPMHKEHPNQEEMSFDAPQVVEEETPLPEVTEDEPVDNTPVEEELAQVEEDSAQSVEEVGEAEETPVDTEPAYSSGIYTSEAVLTRRIRESILREIEVRDKERLAEEARRAVIEKKEREAEMQRLADERREAELNRKELAELREQTRALTEEVRTYTELCMRLMEATPAPEVAEEPIECNPKAEDMTPETAPVMECEDGVCQLVEAQEDDTPDTDLPVVQVEDAEETLPSEQTEQPTEKTYTQSEVEALLSAQEARLLCEMEKRILAHMSAPDAQEPTPTDEAPAQAPSTVEECSPASDDVQPSEETAPEAQIASECDNLSENPDTPTPIETETEDTPTSVIEELLFDDAREAEEKERIEQMQRIIAERQEKLDALRREEEERRERVAELAKKQEELEELARIEREKQEEETRRLEEERKRAEEQALETYASHLREAKRLEEELEEAQRRREEEDARIREAEERIEEQRRLAEAAREEQLRKNEEMRQQTAEAEQRLSELYRATELGREMTERTEEESRLATETIEQEEERIREQTLRHEMEARQRAEAERLVLARGENGEVTEPVAYTYTSRVVHLTFDRAIDPNLISKIQSLMSDTIAYFNKSHVPISVRAEMTGQVTLDLNFVRIPKEEEPLLINIVKVLGRSNIGIRRAKIDD